ncbi:hypothetical protein SAMN05428958_11616 [Pantoea sesami]|nr:hypothetical protein SAMN05428958_11616 [Pantoea sesami]
MSGFRNVVIGILAGTSPWILVALFLFWITSETKSRIDDAAYAYPREVISYGLIGAKNDDDVIALIERWKSDEWGAQIGALRVLCANDRDFVDSLGGGDTGAKICRVIK